MDKFNREDLLIETSDGKPSEPCAAYDNGLCIEFGRYCDGCYEHSLRLFSEDKKVKPMLMQLAEPEFMCEECGHKFYLIVADYKIEQHPTHCEYCGLEFDWSSEKYYKLDSIN